MSKWLAPLVALLVLAGCAGESPVSTADKRESRPAETRTTSSPGLSAGARLALAKRGIKPHEDGPLTVRSQCSHVDETGTSTRLELNVADGAVDAFEADVLIKGRGRCRFALADFRQETRTPHALLRQKKHPECTVRMWAEQGDKVTVAFTSCYSACEKNAFEYLWPILVEAGTGNCY